MHIIQLVHFCFVFLELSCNKITKKEYLILIEIVKKTKPWAPHSSARQIAVEFHLGWALCWRPFLKARIIK